MKNKTINEFSQVLSSAAPVPGGGGASALMGNVSSSLCSMVANLTSGKKKYAEYQGNIERILVETAELNEKFLELMQKDAEVFEPLSKAYGIPKETEGRDQILEEALKVASSAPYEIVETCYKTVALTEELCVKGSRLAISDVAVAASAVKAAASGAAMNVYINTKLMKDRAYAEEMNKKTIAMVKEIDERASKVYETVMADLVK